MNLKILVELSISCVEVQTGLQKMKCFMFVNCVQKRLSMVLMLTMHRMPFNSPRNVEARKYTEPQSNLSVKISKKFTSFLRDIGNLTLDT